VSDGAGTQCCGSRRQITRAPRYFAPTQPTLHSQISCLRGAAEENNNYYQKIQQFISTLEADIIVLFFLFRSAVQDESRGGLW